MVTPDTAPKKFYTTTEYINRISVEFEYKKDRLVSSNDMDLAWVLDVNKKLSGLDFTLNIVSDPLGTGSKKTSDIGFFLRTTASF